MTRYGLFFLMALLVVGDTLTSIYLTDGLKFSLVLKAVIILLLVINLNFTNRALLLGLLLLGGLVTIGITLNSLQDLTPKFALFFEYISGLLFFNFLIQRDFKKELSTILTAVFIFYCATILVAFLFQWDFLKTYYGHRFGYMPFFSSQNEFSFIMIAIVVFFYKKYAGLPSKFNLGLLILSLASALLLGTKVSYLFTFSFLTYFIVKRYSYKIWLWVGAILVLFLILFKNKIFDFIYLHNKVLMDVYSEHGFLNLMSSMRYDLLAERMNCQFQSMVFYNYLFGGINLKCITEMSLIDILLMFGIVGGLLYFYLLRRFILKKLKLDLFGYYVIITVTLLSFLAGYFFENLSAQFYIIGVIYLYYFPSQDPSQKIEASQ